MARFLFGIARGPRAAYVATLHPTWVNGQPGRLMLDPAGRTVGVLTIDIAAGRIQTIRFILNPDKLRHLQTPPGEPTPDPAPS